MKVRLRLSLVLVSLLLSGCIQPSQDEVVIPLFVSGTPLSDSVMSTGDVPVQIDRADLAFGPLYLCAGASAGDLCDTARLEWLGTEVVDTTSGEPQEVGALMGTTGPVGSYMYDLGISSQLTRDDPYILEAAASLGDASFVVSGEAMVDGVALPFRAALQIQQNEDTELGVPVIRKSTSERFSEDVGPDTSSLSIRFDPRPWIDGVDFRAYVTRERCADGGADLVCDGAVERTCDGEREISSRDCAASGQVCLPGEGCADELVIPDQSTAYRSLRNALVIEGRPSFEWSVAP